MEQNKYKKGAGLAQQIQEERAFEESQRKLKERHKIQDDNVVVVEKKSTTRFLLTILIGTLKTTAVICVLILATIGLVALIYPLPRGELTLVLNKILADAMTMVGMGG